MTNPLLKTKLVTPFSHQRPNGLTQSRRGVTSLKENRSRVMQLGQITPNLTSFVQAGDLGLRFVFEFG
jgi:hypothetical protein